MVQRIFNKLWQSFLQLNLYRKHSSDIQTAAKEKLATRIYICSLTTTVVIIAIVTAFLIRTVNKTEYSPTHDRFSYLAGKYPTTLYCPCSTIGIAYNTFVTVDARFHQVCSSEFIKQTWIDRVFVQQDNTSLVTNDYRFTLSYFWQAIAGLCNTSNITWYDIIANYNATRTFNPVAITEQAVQAIAQSSLNNTISISRTRLHRNLLTIQQMLRGNQVVSALGSNFYLRYPSGSSNPRMSVRFYGNCSCLRSSGCPHPATIIDTYGYLVPIPGMVADCFVMDGTLASTLECYYNQSCLSLLHPSYPLPIKSLSNNSVTHFPINSTVEMLFNELMIEDVISDVRFDLFYAQCNPAYCYYSYNHRFDILFILTTIIGVFGGISLALRTIAPFIATIILRWMNKNTHNENLPYIAGHQSKKLHIILNHLRSLLSSARGAIVNLNLFESQIQRTPTIIFRQILLTRLFLLLLIISSIAAGIYIFLIVQSQVVIIKNPSLATYEQLYNDHTDTLQCPCSQKSVSYGTFLNVTFDLHPVCSSDLVSSQWLNYLELFDPINLPDWAVYGATRDFRTIGSSYFQLVSILCSVSKNNIENAQTSFSNTQFVNDHVLALHRFIQQINDIIESYFNRTTNDFQQMVNWIALALGTNHFLIGTNTNSYITIGDNDIMNIGSLQFLPVENISHEYISFKDTICICPSLSSICSSMNLIYTTGAQPLEYEEIFSELVISCTPFETLARSYTNWWYDQNYLEIIRDTYFNGIHTQSPPQINSLNISFLQSQSANSWVHFILKGLLADQGIKNETRFDIFYNQCAPILCSYTISQRNNVIVALLLLISICGGLNEILHILVHAFGKSIFFLIDWWNNNNHEHRTPSSVARVKYLFYSIKKSMINFNLYKTESSNEIDVRQQIIYTRTYVILFTSILSVLLFYTALIERDVIKTFSLPSIEDYEQLLQLHSKSVNCPCSRISIPYHEFVTELHAKSYTQICATNTINISSTTDAVRKKRSTLNNNDIIQNLFLDLTASLITMCHTAQDNIKNSINFFNNLPMFARDVIQRTQFYDEMNTTLVQFQQRIPIEYIQTLNLIRMVIQSNALMTIFSSNWQIIRANRDLNENASFYNVPVIYVDLEQNINCSCATSQACTVPIQFYDIYDESLFTIETMRVGCYALESTLKTSFACFYDPVCSYKIFGAMGQYSEYPMADPIVSSNLPLIDFNSTRFNINDTIEMWANQMFIDSWITNVSYERFFNSCNPTYCTYREYYRFDALELLTTFLSVYAGLSFGIWFIVPYLIQMIYKIRNRFRIVPVQQ